MKRRATRRVKKQITSLGQYMEVITSLHEIGLIQQYLDPTRNVFIFRGMSDYAYTLLPSIFRKQKYKVPNDDNEYEDYVYSSFFSHGREQEVLSSFILEASGLVNIPQENSFRWAEYAQHFGVPTRFLDWTSNPLVALHFACRERKEDDGVVWLLDTSRYGELYAKYYAEIPESDKKLTKQEIFNQLLEGVSSLELPFRHQPLYVDSRMSAQASQFMVWGNNKQPLEDILSDKSHNLEYFDDKEIKLLAIKRSNVLYRIKIPARNKQRILRELDLIGISEKSLFPGLDGIGKYIERSHRIDVDEFLYYDKKLSKLK